MMSREQNYDIYKAYKRENWQCTQYTQRGEEIQYIDASSQPEEANRLNINEEPPLSNDCRENGIGTSLYVLL